jgi:hypothetical protein
VSITAAVDKLGEMKKQLADALAVSATTDSKDEFNKVNSLGD